MALTRIREGVGYLDLLYQGEPKLIAAGILGTPEGWIVVDPGPAVSLDRLRDATEEAGLPLSELRAVLLTHIHLDHAGGTGALVATRPDVPVYVHHRGAPHVAEPGRLLASARRIYGETMEGLWGSVLPVPAGQLRPLEGGERLEIAGRRIEVAYTPGHAVHHVSFLDEATGTVFAGDVAGMRLTGVDCVVPVAPPPDIDVPAWRDSLVRLRAWRPERLFLTHFGSTTAAASHLDRLEEQLVRWTERVARDLAAARDPDVAAEVFSRERLEEIRSAVSAEAFPAYARFGSPRESWKGLARHVRRTKPGEPYV